MRKCSLGRSPSALQRCRHLSARGAEPTVLALVLVGALGACGNTKPKPRGLPTGDKVPTAVGTSPDLLVDGGSAPRAMSYTPVSLVSARYDTGAAFADVNGDGFPDLVMSDGNDSSSGDVRVFYNDGHGKFDKARLWTSAGSAHYMTVATGDVNGDGLADVAVARDGSVNGTGGADVFLTEGGALGRVPASSYAAPSGSKSFAFSVALGDADADGDLDLAVAFAIEPSLRPPTGTPCPGVGAGHVRIYANDGGRFSPEPVWTSAVADFNASLAFVDVDRDGWLDLAVGSSALRVHMSDHGQLAREATVLSATAPPALASNGWIFFLSPASAGPHGPTSLFGSRQYRDCHNPGAVSALSSFELHTWTGAGLEERWRWARPEPQWKASGALAMDLDGDGWPDGVGAAHTVTGLWIWPGQPGGSLAADPSTLPPLPRPTSRAQAVAAADLRRRCVRTYREQFDATGPVVTLSRSHVHRVLSVSTLRDPALPERVVLPATAYALSSSGSTLSVDSRHVRPDGVRTPIEVEYESSSALDLVVVHQWPSSPAILYRSDGGCVPAEPASTAP